MTEPNTKNKDFPLMLKYYSGSQLKKVVWREMMLINKFPSQKHLLMIIGKFDREFTNGKITTLIKNIPPNCEKTYRGITFQIED